VAATLERVAEQFSRLAHRLVEATSAAAGVVTWPERFEKFVAVSGAAACREGSDEFGCRLPPWVLLLAARGLERPQKQHAREGVEMVTRLRVRRQSFLGIAPRHHLRVRSLRLRLIACGESEDGWRERCGVYAPIRLRDRRVFSPCERAA